MATKKQAVKAIDAKSPSQILHEQHAEQEVQWRRKLAFTEANDRLSAVREFIADCADEKLRNKLNESMVVLRDQIAEVEFARRQRRAQEFDASSRQEILVGTCDAKVPSPCRY